MRQVPWELVKEAILDYGRSYTHNEHSRELIIHVETALRRKKRHPHVVHNGVRAGVVLRPGIVAQNKREVL